MQNFILAIITFAVQAPLVTELPAGGWAVLLLQAGSFGLLCIIVVKLGPQMLKDGRDERERRDASFTSAIRELGHDYDKKNGAILEAIKEQTGVIQAKEDETNRMLAKIVAKLGDSGQSNRP